MTDIKRHYDNLLDGAESPFSMSSDPSKKQSKPGRRPIDSEPKSKRTAQNRAAQRAYRERKEKKMKDLEDKVKDLEDENLKIYTETDLLKAQIDVLKGELTKYKGDGFEIKLPTTVGKLSHPNSDRLNSKSSSDFSDSRSSNSSVNESSPDTDISDSLLKSEFPWADKNLQYKIFPNTKDEKSLFDTRNTDNNVPDLVSGSSSSTSPLNENILMDSNSRFDEQLEPFCNKLNEACGTKECPIPKTQQDTQTPQVSERSGSDFASKPVADSPFGLFNNDQLFNDTFNFNLTPKEDNDPLSFLNDNNFDVNLAFDDNTSDRISSVDNLVTEESQYDPLKDEVNTNFNFNEFIKSSLPSESSPARDAEEVEIVPAPEKTFKCSEIWDRITSHPRYTEIDIDGLCSELKSKAKCSERGVVINATDVNSLLEKSARQR